jgi:hypothetical protein
MTDLNYLPKDLEKVVHKQMGLLKTDAPDLKILTELFETLYFASMKTEERKAISCYVVYRPLYRIHVGSGHSDERPKI